MELYIKKNKGQIVFIHWWWYGHSLESVHYIVMEVCFKWSITGDSIPSLPKCCSWHACRQHSQLNRSI